MEPQLPGQPQVGGQAPPGAVPVTPNPAQTVGIVLVACALAIAIGTFTKSWFAHSDGGMQQGLGLLGMKMCMGGRCLSMSWDQMGSRTASDLPIWGYIGFLGGLAAIVACGLAGGMALSRNTHKIPLGKPLQIPLGIAAFGMTAFVVRILFESDAPRLSYSGFVALAGVIAAGFVIKQMLEPLVKQAKAALPAGAMPPTYQLPPAGQPLGASPVAAPSTCPRCNGPIEYVAQYQRYFCRSCNQYV